MMKFYKKPFLPLIEFLGRLKAEKRFTEPPILIGGCGRSGTTILLSIVSAHPQVFACPKELGLFNKIKYDAEGNPGPHRIDRLYRAVLTSKVKKTASRFVEKSPSNVKQIEVIDQYFKEYKFIHIIRDGRDVVLSIHPTDKSKYWVDPERWVHDVSAGLEHLHNPHVLTIFYEDLMQNYQETMRQICQHCNLPLTPEIENWFEHTTVKKNKAYHGGVNKINTRSIGKWQAPEHQERVQELLDYPGAQELLEKLGYLKGQPSLEAFQPNTIKP